ncbi:MAG: DUF86 domain-containing protein [Candidatus Rokubacteria bacterium]|nr:DUF86 domain-containing protein [Candidatus Rokubacteria bacterium]
MVDKSLLAAKIAAVRDAVARIRSVMPESEKLFLQDRTAREIVALNLFVGIQNCLDLASHWLADEGWDVPGTYGQIFMALADHQVIDGDLAFRVAGASGLRNLIAHQYGIVDWRRIYAVATSELEDLEAFCAALAAKGG